MANKSKYKLTKKDVLFGVITFVLLGYQIHIYISQSELTSIDVLFPQRSIRGMEEKYT